MRGHRIALAPNDAQATYLARAAGTARFAYNWALAEWQRQYREHREDESLLKPSQQALRRQLNAIKREKFPWMLEVTKNAPQMANRHLARAVGDAGFREFRRQVEYKAPMRGGLVVVAGRWFPSSKMCSACGQRRERLPLSVRHWTCTACGSGHDRDVNAAVNLRSHAVSSTVKACGEACSGRDGGVRRIVPVKPASAKQEVSFGYV